MTGIVTTNADGVLRIVIDRPERKGSLSPDAVQQMIEAIEAASTDDALRVIVLSSSGPDFCSGADWVSTNTDTDVKPRTGSIQRRTPVQAHRLIALLMEVQLPVVCAVRGWAAGLGCQLALASDFAVADEDATFWLPFAKRGFTPDSGSTWLLPRLIGMQRAKELAFFGDWIPAATAREYGLVNAIFEGSTIEAAVDEKLVALAERPPIALAQIKQSLHRASVLSMSEALEIEAVAQAACTSTEDTAEGMRAFLEKRPPRFTGR